MSPWGRFGAVAALVKQSCTSKKMTARQAVKRRRVQSD